MVSILIADEMSPIAVEALVENGIETDVLTDLQPNALAEIIGRYDGLAVRSSTKVTAEIIARGERLKVIGRAGIGVDNIDIDTATEHGVVVMNTPMGNTITTAEHTIAMMCSMARQIPQADISTRTGRWEKGRFMGMELCQKTLGLIGCGNVGSIVATLAQGLKMRVLVHDPYLAPERAKSLAVQLVCLDDLLQNSDVISMHAPLSADTRHMLDATAFSKAKKGVCIINCARGGLISEDDLRDAIERGHVSGAALDVFENEPATDNPLFSLEQVIVTPHLGASTVEAQENVAFQIAQQMAEFLLDGVVTNGVNAPSVAPEELEKLGPYLSLAEQLGSFGGQLAQGRILGVRIEYEGQASMLDSRLLTSAALQGLLDPQLDSVNMVNALSVARDRGIEVKEFKGMSAEDYLTLVRVIVQAGQGKSAIAGTLVGGNSPRVVEVNGIKIEAELGPDMLYLENQDRPGLIGAVASTLGRAGVNIATFNLGRKEPGGDALGLIGVDSQVSNEVLRKLQAQADVTQVRRLSF